MPDRLLALALVFATLLAYHPAWRAGFIWDDDFYVTGNELLTAHDGLRRIWFSLDSPSQYFPLTYTTFYFERLLWGLNPAGYHCVNIVLHAANVLLCWRVLAGLRAPGTWLGAALFALHPVQVESVAWISERKNVLMGFFFLMAMLAWMKFIEGTSKRPWRIYAAALACYVLALFAKTTACTLPAALLLVLWIRKMPIGWRRLAQVAPFVALGAMMGVATMWWERFHQGTQGGVFSMSFIERVFVASRAIWFYAGKLIWPVNLTFSYPRWTINPSDPLAYAWLAAAIILVFVILIARRRLGRGVETGVIFFAATLSPMLGFIMLYTFRYSFVADHYQYLACVGPLALIAGGIDRGFDKLARGARSLDLKPIVCGVLLAVLGVLTWLQCRQYANSETLWSATLARNPASWMAHDNLGNALRDRGSLDEAVAHYRKALELHPDFPEGLNDFGAALADEGKTGEAIERYEEALKLEPDFAKAHYNFGNALVKEGKVVEAIAQYRGALLIQPRSVDTRINLGLALLQIGQTEEAIGSWEQVLAIRPDFPLIEDRLAWLLSTVPDASLRNGPKAVALAEKANKASRGQDPAILYTLAAAYAETGRFAQAIATAQTGLTLAKEKRNDELAGTLQKEVESFEGGKPVRGAR